MSNAVRAATQAAHRALAQLQQAAAAAGPGGPLRDEARAMVQEAAALLESLERQASPPVLFV